MRAQRAIPASDLMLAPDGSVFHLRMMPDDLADTVIMVGDPGRVDLVMGHLEGVREVSHHREFRSAVGRYRGRAITVLSHGIGCGCIDIVLNELDALANIDLERRVPLVGSRRLRLVRIGTAGTLSADVAAGEAIVTAMAIGLDGLAWYYEAAGRVADRGCSDAIGRHLSWPEDLPSPYAVRSTPELVACLSPLGRCGMTLSCPGFYAPQARMLRLAPRMRSLVARARTFVYDSMPLLNLEMESASLTVLASALGHDAVTVTLAIDNRKQETTLVDYRAGMDRLIASVLDAVVA